MKQISTMSLGEFRELTKDMPDEAAIMLASDRVYHEAVGVHPYPLCTSLDNQGSGIVLLEGETGESVHFIDYC